MKKYYRIESTGEGTSSGFLLLTEKEAKFLEYCLNPENWEKRYWDRWCAETYIDVEHPLTKNKYDKIPNNRDYYDDEIEPDGDDWNRRCNNHSTSTEHFAV